MLILLEEYLLTSKEDFCFKYLKNGIQTCCTKILESIKGDADMHMHLQHKGLPILLPTLFY